MNKFRTFFLGFLIVTTACKSNLFADPTNTPTFTPILASTENLNEEDVDCRSEKERALYIENRSDYQASWSPDGGQIAFISTRAGDWDVFVMDTDGSNQRLITDDAHLTLLLPFTLVSLTADQYPDWSPDGSRLVYSSNRDNKFMNWIDENIYIHDLSTNEQIRISETNDMEAVPRWSPDGKSILYSIGLNTCACIYLMNADGTNVRPLIELSAQNDFAEWSPDGNKVVFESDINGNQDIYTININGSNLLQLTFDPGADGFVAWSPDGERIAFASDRTGNWDIFLMNVDGSNVTQLTSADANEIWPSWSPDMTKIAYTTDEDGDGDIVVLDLESGQVTKLTEDEPFLEECKDADYYYELGIATLFIEGIEGDALGYFEKAVELDSEHVRALLAVGLINYLQTGGEINQDLVKAFEMDLPAEYAIFKEIIDIQGDTPD